MKVICQKELMTEALCIISYVDVKVICQKELMTEAPLIFIKNIFV